MTCLLPLAMLSKRQLSAPTMIDSLVADVSLFIGGKCVVPWQGPSNRGRCTDAPTSDPPIIDTAKLSSNRTNRLQDALKVPGINFEVLKVICGKRRSFV